MSTNKHLPLPYFKINSSLEILETSDIAKQTFPVGLHFLDLVDDASKEKAKKHLIQSRGLETELVLKTNRSPFTLCKVCINWEADVGHILCIEQDQHIEQLMKKVNEHRQRLEETDMALLLKKEELEKSLQRIILLSGPAIFLSKNTVLVPFFGDLTKELIQGNREKLLNSINDEEIDRVIIDFQGIGALEEEGIEVFVKLIADFKIMGVEPYVSGLTPQHAAVLNRMEMNVDIEYLSNLMEAVNRFLVQPVLQESLN
ncbi:STAS domain-containing protein [Metabacillus iocasae]|uniref:Anti-anti-sigma regulatory factor n=1 Tax=Priestia iocasae TaxID=2291674 RepID=A0ABS2QZY5_9BACI|nr:STAS domain-containing protein [Metabacillus iocasae]MBM7704296.1 anti-anti-sigma regulatory factor [Metabacillus iocasae]